MNIYLFGLDINQENVLKIRTFYAVLLSAGVIGFDWLINLEDLLVLLHRESV